MTTAAMAHSSMPVPRFTCAKFSREVCTMEASAAQNPPMA